MIYYNIAVLVKLSFINGAHICINNDCYYVAIYVNYESLQSIYPLYSICVPI